MGRETTNERWGLKWASGEGKIKRDFTFSLLSSCTSSCVGRMVVMDNFEEEKLQGSQG